MSNPLMLRLQTALETLANQHTEDTLGDRSTYLGASDIGSCPRKTILSKISPPKSDLVTLLRYRRGHMAEDIIANAFTVAGFTNFKRQVAVRYTGDIPIIAHIDFVFISESRKTMAVLEVKSPEDIPEHPYGSWESQLYLQMGLLEDCYPDYTVEKGAILAVNLGSQGMQLFEEYAPQETIYQGLINRAGKIWNQYQQFYGDATTPTAEVSPLCGYCAFLQDCPQFAGEEIPELAECVAHLAGLQRQQKDLESQISQHKNDLLAIVEQRGPFKANGQLLRKAIRSRRVLDSDRLAEYLQEYGRSLADFQKISSYSFLEIKRAA